MGMVRGSVGNVPVFKGSRPLNLVYGRFLRKEKGKFTIVEV